MIIQVIERALSDASGNDYSNALLAQPMWERTRFVRRGCDDLGIDGGVVFRIHLHQSKLPGFSQMSKPLAFYN